MTISISSTMFNRARCSYCGHGPKYSCSMSTKLTLKNPLAMIAIRNFMWEKDNTVRRKNEMPNMRIPYLRDLKVKIQHSKVGIRGQQYFGASPLELNKKIFKNLPLCTAVFCACYKMVWVIPIDNREHITNRRSQRTGGKVTKLF